MDRKCLVTGSSRGIGRAISDELRSAGYEVIGLGRARPDSWRGEFIVCDITSVQDLEAATDRIAQIGDFWGLVNNAAVNGADPIEQITHENMARMFMGNAIAPSILTRAVVPTMQSGGRIVNICSNGGLGRAERSSYGASKAALVSLTRTWALELGSRGITVNAISPGPTDTEMLRFHVPVGSPAEARLAAGIPAGRLGTAADVASFVSLLLDSKSSYCTGQTIHIDGGASIGRIPL